MSRGTTPGSRTIDPAVVALLVATFIWGSTYVVTKGALDDVGPFTILLGRLVLGTMTLAPFAWRRGYRPRLALRREYVLFGLTGMVLHLGFEIVGLHFTSASSAALIIATAPVVTVAFAVVLLKEHVSRLQLAGIAASIAGVVLVTGTGSAHGGHPTWLGNLLVFAGVVTWGAFTVQGKRLALDHSWLVATTAATTAAIVLTLPLAAGEIAIGGAPHFSMASVGAVVFLGVFAQGVAYSLWNLALGRVDGSVAGAYINIVPVVGVALALLVGEALTPLQIAGGIVVALGVWTTQRGRRARSSTRRARMGAGRGLPAWLRAR